MARMKLIFDLEDQGGEQLVLRYDHTVLLARYLAMGSVTNTQSRLWQVGKVYRRDNPVMSEGRRRYVVNHRKILDGIFEVCGVPPEKICPISSAVDKLDKLPWSDVRKEMIGDDTASADKTGEYVKHNGTQLFHDYYMDLMYEAIVEASALPVLKATEKPDPTPAVPKKKSKKSGADEDEEIDESQVGVGSIATGGWYDDLVGMFMAAASSDGKKGAGLPCIGVSIRLDCIFVLLWPKWVKCGMRSKEVFVYVLAVGDGLLPKGIALVQELRAQGIAADFLAKNKPKLNAQFAAGERHEEQRWEFVDGKKAKVELMDKGM
ncbi:histidyl-tRNA synthetase [Lactarius pseudohatsudake]|nr:histidyl-tRNA synthetase [Lactarius pseudohatsudake]